MAANTRARAVAYGANDLVTSTELQTIQVQAAESVNRNSSSSGWRTLPPCLMSQSVYDHFLGGIFTQATSNTTLFSLVGLPNGHSLVATRIKLFPGDNVRSGNPPEHLPEITLIRWPYASSSIELLATQTYTWVDEATYEHANGIVLTATPASPVTINTTDNAYVLSVTTEYGTNAFGGTVFGGIQANVTLDLAEGGVDFKFW